MKFKYFKFPLPKPSPFFGKSVLRPIVPVSISQNNISLRYAALIDSGADFCIFDGEVGEYLGLDVRSGKKVVFSGVQQRGGATAFFHDVTINIGGWNCKSNVGFSYELAKHSYGILGQKGFFDIFIVKFDLMKEEIELKHRLPN